MDSAITVLLVALGAAALGFMIYRAPIMLL